LQNVRTYRPDVSDADQTTAVVPFLLFRGTDIKDLHVHEEEVETNTTAAAPPPPPVAAAVAPPVAAAEEPAITPPAPAAAAAPIPATAEPRPVSTSAKVAPESSSGRVSARPSQRGRGSGGAPDRSGRSSGRGEGGGGRGGGRGRGSGRTGGGAAIGTGASLLRRSDRGQNSNKPKVEADFDFTAQPLDFKNDHEDDEAGDQPVTSSTSEPVLSAYHKDNFFDSISCDALDRASGIDTRLRNSDERHLNTETFGAVSLPGRRRPGGRGRGRGRGGGRGRSGGGRNNSGGGYRNSTTAAGATS
jgi:protein LSM14